MEALKIDYISLLKNIVAKRFAPPEYSMEGYRENSVCMEGRKDGTWEVYYGERNQKHGLILCADPVLACMAFIRKIGDDGAEAMDMEAEFVENLMESFDRCYEDAMS